MAAASFSNVQQLVDDYVKNVDETYGIQIGLAIGVVTPTHRPAS